MMLFRIAEIVGSTVADLHEKLTYREFQGWVSYLNGKGPDVTEIQLAVLTNWVASGLGSKKSQVTDYILSKTDSKKVKPKTAFDSFASIATDFKGPKK